MNQKLFLIRLIKFTAICAVILCAVNYFIPFFQSFQIFSWCALMYFFTLTMLAGYIGIRSLQKSAHGFVASVNGIVMIKLFLSAAFIIGYAIIAKPQRPDFVISFFLLYVAYTVLLVREFILAQKNIALQKDGNH